MGIGAIYADRLARRGYDLILVARNRERLEELANRLRGETGRIVEVVTADLNNRSDLGLIETLLGTDTRVTMLVNNAGIGAMDTLPASNVDKMDDIIARGAGGTFGGGSFMLATSENWAYRGISSVANTGAGD
ncbi:SDR family NAD(P)-dependent oxidoreductase [Mesorhizobium sp. 128a]